MDVDQRGGVAERQRPEERRVDGAEDRRTRADAEGEDEDRARGEAPVAPEPPHRVPHVTRERVDRTEAAGIPRAVGDPGAAAERPARRPLGVAGRHPRGDVLLDLLLEVKPQLAIDLAFDSVPPERSSKMRRPAACPAHGVRSLSSGS